VAASIVLAQPQDQVPFVEVSALHLSGLVAPQSLLVSRGVHQDHGAGFVQLVQRVLAGSLVGALVVAPNSGRPILQVRGEDSPVALLGVVQMLHTTAGSSWSHF
jgi:hypothetical protein